jgi:hypothetical protein
MIGIRRIQSMLLALACCAASLGGLSASASGATPTVTGINPNNGQERGGTSITITGTGFISGSTVKLGGNAATNVTVESETKIKAVSPQGKGTVDALVANANGTSATMPVDQFAYDEPPSEHWLGLNGNSLTYLGPVGFFAEHGAVYARVELAAGELPVKGDELEVAIDNNQIPVIPIEYAGYEGNLGKPDPNFPTEANGKLAPYVKGFVETAQAVLKTYPGKKVLFEPMNEPWDNTEPTYNGAEYAKVVAKLLPEARAGGIPLGDIYIAAFGYDCTQKECGGESCTKGCVSNGWIPAMYEAQPKLETQIQGWYLHPYGHPTGAEFGDSRGIESVPLVQEKMTSGQNNIIVSEVGFCALDVDEGIECGGLSNPTTAENSIAAGGLLSEMLDNAQPYHQAGWLKALLLYSRNAGGWAMQEITSGGFLTAQGSAFTSFADAEQVPTSSSSFGKTGSGEGQFEIAWGVALDPRNGNVYVSDNKTDHIEEFEANGTFITSFGTAGSGNGQLKDPEALAVDAEGDLYVGDSGNHRVEEFNSAHEYVRKFGTGSEGSSNGEFGNAIGGVTVDASGDVWASDGANDRVEEFSSTGGYLNKFGSEGSGNDQFSDPEGLAFDNGDLYVVDHFNHRVQELSASGSYIGQFGTLGEGEGQFEAPAGIAADPRTGNLYVTDYNADRVEELSVSGVFISFLGEFGSGKGQFNDPQGIATNATGSVYIVDFGNHRVQTWSSPGSAWSSLTTANPSEASAAQLLGIACTTGCIAVGSYTNSAGTELPLAEEWTGAEWTLQSAQTPSGAKASGLVGVSCPVYKNCTAVGASTNSANAEVTMAESWNGTQWKVQSTPSPSQAKMAALGGVSCATATACTAVGSTVKASTAREPLALGWNGKEWSLQSAALPKGAKAGLLAGVSCTTSSACTAVGSDTGSGGEVALAEESNGKAWTVQSVPTPSQAKASVFAGVACVIKACAAIGSFTSKAGVVEPLAASYNGSEWALQSVPLSNGAKGGELTGVSCISAAACTAVGSYVNKKGARETLALAWNGTLWSLQSTPNPSEGKGAVSAGVACVWITGCYDVGSYTNSKGTLLTLGQKYFG